MTFKDIHKVHQILFDLLILKGVLNLTYMNDIKKKDDIPLASIIDQAILDSLAVERKGLR